jgi:hypothetical protein
MLYLTSNGLTLGVTASVLSLIEASEEEAVEAALVIVEERNNEVRPTKPVTEDRDKAHTIINRKCLVWQRRIILLQIATENYGTKKKNKAMR